MLVAALLAVGSFALMFDGTNGGCVSPREFLLVVFFLVLSVPCFVGVGWFAAELGQLLARRVRPQSAFGFRRSLLVGFAACVAIGLIVWAVSPPLPSHGGSGLKTEFQVFYGVLWPVGILAEIGTFTNTSCGH